MNNYTRKNFSQSLLFGLSALAIVLGSAYLGVLFLIRFFSSPFEPISPLRASGQTFVVVIATLALCAEVYWLTEAYKWLQGNEGEKMIGRQLRKLPHYIVLDNIVLNTDHGNIDFVVIGPKGVAIVEAKSESGHFYFHSGKLRRYKWPLKQDFVWQVESQVNDLIGTLKTGLGKFIPVNPFIAFSSRFARMPFHYDPLPGTRIVAVRMEEINICILSQKGAYLSESEITVIANFLKKYQRK